MASAAAAGDFTQRSGLTNRVARGIAWKGLTQVVVQVVRFVVGLVLARLLTPGQFGLAGMALVLSGFVAIFTDMSLGAALVQRRELTERDRSTIFWAMTAVGALCTGGGVAFSGLAASFFGQSQVRPLFAALSVCFVLNSLNAVQSALLVREMQFRALQIREMGAAIAGGAVALALAFEGAGSWAIIGQAISVSVASVVLLWSASSWRPRFVFSLASLRDVGGYGMKLFASRILSFLQLNTDNLLVGRVLGAAQLGIYSLAFNLMFAPMLQLAQPINDVVFPAYARMQDDPARLARAWLRGKRIAAAVLAPAFIGILVTSSDLVPVVFGRKWNAAVPVVALLALGGATFAVSSLNWTIQSATGRAGTLLKLNLLQAGSVVAAFVVGLHWGVVGVAGFFALAQWLVIVPTTAVAARAAEVSLREPLQASLPGLIAAAGMGAGVFALRVVLVHLGIPAAARLPIEVAAGAAAYPMVLRVIAPDIVRTVRELIPRPSRQRLVEAPQ